MCFIEGGSSSGPMEVNNVDNGRGFMVAYAARKIEISFKYKSDNLLSKGEKLVFINCYCQFRTAVLILDRNGFVNFYKLCRL